MSVKAQISKIEKKIFPTKLGGVDQKILDSLRAINDRMNILKAGFSREKQFKWFKVFGTLPKPVEYEECFEAAKQLTERYGDFETYIRGTKDNKPMDSLSPEKRKLLKEIFRD